MSEEDDWQLLAAKLGKGNKGDDDDLDMEAAGAGNFPSIEEERGMGEEQGSSDDGMETVKKGKKKKKGGGFQSFGLSKPILKGVLRVGYTVPTPIQRKAIPIQADGRDVVAMARTGSGKTAAYMLPLLNRLGSHSVTVGARGLILSPTRELAIQILKVAKQLGKFTDLRYCVIVGGLALSEQFTDLAGNPDIIIASPGRLLHIVMETDMKLKRVETVVLDEADRLFETGVMASQIHEIMKRLPDTRQTCLYSATMPSNLVEFATAGLQNPQLIRLDTEVKISEKLKLSFFTVRREEKAAALVFILKELIGLPASESQTIVFAPTKHHAEYIHQLLDYIGLDHSVIHGSMDQEARTIQLQAFAARKTFILVVTDVAARGVDIPLLDNVVNFECPDRPKLFVHRVGRAARAGRSGVAYSIVSKDEIPHVIDLHLFLGRPLKNKVEGESADLEDGYIGRLPIHLLDVIQGVINTAKQDHFEFENQERVCGNAFKLYFRTRRGASSQSVKKAKDLELDAHPLLLTERFTSAREVEKKGLVESLHNFKPAVNIFDAMKHGAKGIFAPGVLGDGAKKFNVKKAKRAVPEAPAPDAKPKTLRASLLARIGKPSVETKAKKRQRDEEIEKEREQFYIPYQNTNKYEDAGYSVNDIRDAELDVTADTNEGMQKQRMVYAWNKKKKRYVKMNIGDAKALTSKTKNEAGKRIDFNKGEQGKYLRKWEKQTNIRIQQAGEDEDTQLTATSRARKKAKYTSMAEDDMFQEDEAEKDKPKIKLGHRGKKKQAIRSAEVKSFEELRKEKKKGGKKGGGRAGGKASKGGKKGGGGGKKKKK
eukprot:Sspe_Gene.29230::Locus_13750_Transcript_1_1_Confidence_1.000_Length_2543::g.29230::m.29230/K14808/DDX54, DBP10; ATP-dependent RNA helicase DDX54/DBP10